MRRATKTPTKMMILTLSSLSSGRKGRKQKPLAHPPLMEVPAMRKFVKRLRGKGQGRKGQRVQISKLRSNRTKVCLRPAQISKLRLCRSRLYLKIVDVPLLVEAWMLPPAVRSPMRAHPGMSGRGERMMPSLLSLLGVD